VIESVVCWKWSKPGYRSSFDATSVNVLRNQVARHYPHPHRFICVTDDPTGIADGIEVYPIGSRFFDLRNPTWSWGPNCFPRLQAFAPEFETVAGKRFVSMDLDTVITGDLTPLWNRPEDFVIYASVQAGGAYNGSMFMMDTGCRRKVWDEFDPATSPAIANAAGNSGSDQGWIQYILGRQEATWTVKDKIFAYRWDCLKMNRGRLPKGARMVVFHGKFDPWQRATQMQSPWIAEHYR
jgi:hypothetical protein